MGKKIIYITMCLFLVSCSNSESNIKKVETLDELRYLKDAYNIKEVYVKDKEYGGLFIYNDKLKDRDNNRTVIQGWVREYKGKEVSITWFGATPDDEVDDTVAIKEALALSGHITMPRGVYHVKELNRTGVTIIDGNGSVFKSELDTSDNGRRSKNILTLSGEKIEIKNLLLDGAYTSGNAKAGDKVSSLLHIYDSKNILLDHVDTVNYSSNWWDSQQFNYNQLNSNHSMDMYHTVYIGFSDTIQIKNMHQRGNIKTEGLLIYESDNINIENFKSDNSPDIWTSLHIVASDNIKMNSIEVSDGAPNQGGSSINFIANHHFHIQNVKTVNKQGFDISNEIKVEGLRGRVTRDTSYGVIESSHIEGQRALYGYPMVDKSKELLFKNTTFVPTKEGSGTWGARLEQGEDIRFDGCTFGSQKYKTYGIIMGESANITVENSTFINPSTAIYLFGKRFGEVVVENNHFEGEGYTPVKFYWANSRGEADKFIFKDNIFKGEVENNKFFSVENSFFIKKIIK